MSSFLPALSNASCSAARCFGVAVGAHQIQGIVMLLRGKRGVTEGLAVIRVGQRLERNLIRDHAVSSFSSYPFGRCLRMTLRTFEMHLAPVFGQPLQVFLYVVAFVGTIRLSYSRASDPV